MSDQNSLLDVETYAGVDSNIVNVDGEEYDINFDEQDEVLSINNQEITNEDIEGATVIVDGEEFNVNVIEGYIPDYVEEGAWEPWEIGTPCPAGFTCTSMGDSSLGAFSCDEMARLAVDDFGFGNVLAGISCPQGRPGVYNCPVGYYCPDSSTIIECPAGLFCPYKTSEPTFVGGAETCQNCPAGSDTKHLSRKQRIAQGVVLAVLVLLLIIKMCKRKANINNEMLRKRLHFDSIRKGNEKSEVKRKQEMYTRLRPKLEVIAERLGKIRSDIPNSPQDRQLHRSVGASAKDKRRSAVPVTPKSASQEILYVSKSGDIIFDANAMYDVLDQNNDGVLSYSEINAVLCLSDDQLRAFIANMRGKAAAGNDNRTTMATARHDDKVSRTTFVKHFLDALADASQFQPTSEEADELFTRIAGEVGVTKAGEIEYDRLYASSLSIFLTDLQIYGIIQRFKRKKGEQSTKWRSTSRFTLAQHLDGVSRYDFVKFYPQFLSEVCQSESTFTYMSARGDELAPEPEGLDVAFENLCLTVKVGKKEINVVNDVTGRLRSNTMTAVMGGSGSGKSSLLNALCGRASYGNVTGTIKINGNDSLIEEHKAVIGFVPQEDIVYPDLTVRENLLFAGRLYLPKGTCEADIAELSDTTMASLGLSRIANSLVGDARRRGVSGGEKKRVNIGIELMKKPRILFLDEPTSGLDSRSAFVVMESLARLCSQGMTVASVIHQPRTDIYDMFDSLFLLGVGGHTVYHGPATEASSYFESLGFRLKDGDSQADWFLDISSGDIEPESGDIEAGSLSRPSHDSIRRTESNTITDGSISFEVAVQNDHGIGFEVEKEQGHHFVVTHVGKIRYVFSADHYILVGDVIVGVNGRGTKSLSLDEFNALLNQQSDTVTAEGTLFGPVFVQVKRKRQEQGLPPVGYEEDASAVVEANYTDQTRERAHLLADKPANEEGNMLNAKERRDKLYRQWALHFDNILPATKDEFYSPPKAFELPIPPEAVPGWRQLLVQLRRNCLLSYRNRDAKLIDFGIIVIAAFAMTLLGGAGPESFSSGNHAEFFWMKWIASKEDASQMFFLVSGYAIEGVNAWTNYAMMVGLIVSVLIGLNATKVITEKRLEFYREAQAGADVTQYFIAATVSATLEQGFVSVVCSGLAYLVLKPSSVYTVYLWNFFMLSWLSVGWALLIAVIVPLSSVSTVVGFFNAFFGLLFCGKVAVMYSSLYSNEALAIFSAYFSVLRFFVEGLSVSEAKCFPVQSGYTVAENAFNYAIFEEKYPYFYHLTYMAHTDMDRAIVQSCDGWFWWVPAAIVVGIVIRFLGVVAIHLSDRPKQGKKPVREEMVTDFKECRNGTKPLGQSFILKGFLVFILFVVLFAVSCWLILRKGPDVGSVTERS